MSITSLNTRRKRILQAIVEMYIETALPVSSQAITQRLRSQLSAATVRNIMAELDSLGLIWQPHTSAGRIPTDKGYRYYIDAMLEPAQLSQDEKDFIASQYSVQNEAFDEVLINVLRLLSNFSGYTAMAFSSGLRRILLKRLELVSVESAKVLIVLVSREGLVKTTIVQMPRKIEAGQLEKISKFLNEEFEGLTLEGIKKRLAQELLSSTDVFFHIIKRASEVIDLALASFTKDELYLEGTSYILGQPEFQNTQKLQAVLRTFERPEPLLEIMKEDLDIEGIKVHIGKENSYEDIQECSLVISSFKIKNRNMGSLGIIGPRRMSYAKVISAVDYMARIFSERIVDFGL